MISSARQGWEDTRAAALWLTSYLFLLRLPSEALLACKGSPERSDAADKQTLIWREGNEVCLRLLRRKNRPKGSGILRRGCTCSVAGQLLQTQQHGSRFNQARLHMCAVHGLWDEFWADRAEGEQPWQNISPNDARRRLRGILGMLGVPNAHRYGTQDFRRGHAEDMRKSGCTLAEILRAGQWKSAAFMSYLDEAAMDKVSCSTPSRIMVLHCFAFAQEMAFEVAVQSDAECSD